MADERFDLVIIGAGAAGEAAAFAALARGASVAVIEDDLVGGSCAFWACIPSKALLHAAAVHHAGGDFPWQRASDFRDWNIVREGIDYPDDSAHVRNLTHGGAEVVRGRARVAGPGRVEVRTKADGAGPQAPSDGPIRSLSATNIVVAIGSHTRDPGVWGLKGIGPWSNREATSTRTLPKSLLILGGGPTGIELGQVYARYGVPVTLVESNGRVLARDHPRTSAFIRESLERDGVTVVTGVKATSAEAEAGKRGAHLVRLSGGSHVEGHEILVAVGRSFPLDDLGLETVGVAVENGKPPKPDPSLRIAPGVFLIGHPAGPELHTHLAHYEGESAARIALGEDVMPDFRAIPRATYTDPESGSVGLLLDEAQEQGHHRAFEETTDLATSAKGYVTGSKGHVSIVVDGADGQLLGSFICGIGASEAIHEAVLAIKTRTPVSVLADTLHAFPTTARVMGSLFVTAAARVAQGTVGE